MALSTSESAVLRNSKSMAFSNDVFELFRSYLGRYIRSIKGSLSCKEGT